GGKGNLERAKGGPGSAQGQAGELGEGLGVGVDEVGQLHEAVSALLGGGLAPRLEGLAGGGNGGVAILLASQGDVVGDQAVILGAAALELLAVLGLDVLCG